MNALVSNVLTQVFITLIAVSGIYVLTGLTGMFSLGQAAFMAIGSYVSGLLVIRAHVPFALAALLAVAGATLIGYVIGYPVVRLRRDYISLVTLGFGEAIAALLNRMTTLTGGASAMCYTSEDVMAATFNVDLIHDVGRCIGEDCLAMGYSGLYGPGINMHRTAYSGRNFEYYASDPFVAGTICAAEVNGIQSKGVYVYLKHVALNDSESSRRGVNTWLNEQAAREIYLEVADKAVTDGGAWSVMSGFNRWGAYWCGAYDNLLTGFLRGELGMRGMIITDYSGSSKYMDLADGLIAGSDIWDSPDPTIHTTLAPKYENDAYIVTEMRESMHKILYTVANSNAMNGWSSADRLKVITPWWKTALYALDTVLAVLTVLCIWRLVVAIKRKKTWTAEQAANTANAQNQQ